MTLSELDRYNSTLYKLVGDLFSISSMYQSGKEVTLGLLPRYHKSESLKLLEDRLKMAGYKYHIENQPEQILLTVDPKASFKIPKLNIFLFIVTLVSIYIVPVYFRYFFVEPFSDRLETIKEALLRGEGIEFTLAMVSILFVHEMGHYIASRRRDLITSYPYFIPAPNIIGTFGAVIKSKSPFWNRRDLIEVGAAGPIAGWIVAIGWLVFGLMNSSIVHQSELLPFEGFLIDGESLLMRISLLGFLGSTEPEYYYKLTEAAFAGWVGMLVTAINMLPIGQLDGGHIVYGLFQKKQHFVGYIAVGLLLVLGFFSPLWWLFAFMGIMFGIKHPPTLQDSKPLSKGALWMGVVSLLILLISFTPVPFQ